LLTYEVWSSLVRDAALTRKELLAVTDDLARMAAQLAKMSEQPKNIAVATTMHAHGFTEVWRDLHRLPAALI
jgi:hypothetical protein